MRTRRVSPTPATHISNSTRKVHDQQMLNNGGSMKRIYAYINAFGAVVLLAMPASGAVLYNNLTPNNQIAVATRPENGTDFEIEAGDDFLLGNRSIVNSASFIGLGVPGAQGGNFAVSNV